MKCPLLVWTSKNERNEKAMGILGQKQKPKKVVMRIMMKTTTCQIDGQMTNSKKCVQMVPLSGIISKKYPKTFLIPLPPK